MTPLLRLFILLLACTLCWGQEPANDTAEATEETAGEETEEANSSNNPGSKFGTSFSTQNNPQLLAKDLPDKQVMWMDINGEKVLSLYSPDHSGQARGGVILFPRYDTPLSSHSLLFNLQQTLADNRWHALTLPIPSFSEQANVESLSRQYIESAITFLNDKGIFNMVILGEGKNAHRVLAFANKLEDEEQAKQIRGLALLNPENNGIDPPVEALIPKLTFPVLDIYFDANLKAKRDAKTRLRNSRSMPKMQFQQVRMLPLANNPKVIEDRLSKRVRGWLDKTAAGFSVGVDR